MWACDYNEEPERSESVKQCGREDVGFTFYMDCKWQREPEKYIYIKPICWWKKSVLEGENNKYRVIYKYIDLHSNNTERDISLSDTLRGNCFLRVRHQIRIRSENWNTIYKKRFSTNRSWRETTSGVLTGGNIENRWLV